MLFNQQVVIFGSVVQERIPIFGVSCKILLAQKVDGPVLAPLFKLEVRELGCRFVDNTVRLVEGIAGDHQCQTFGAEVLVGVVVESCKLLRTPGIDHTVLDGGYGASKLHTLSGARGGRHGEKNHHDEGSEYRNSHS